MIDPTFCTFIPQTLPPTDRAAAAYWFAFQDQRMIVRTAGNTVGAPLLTDLAALGLTPVRQQYLGYLEDGQAEPIHCYSAEIDPAVALADGLVAEGLREALCAVGRRAVQRGGSCRTDHHLGPHASVLRAVRQADRGPSDRSARDAAPRVG